MSDGKLSQIMQMDFVGQSVNSLGLVGAFNTFRLGDKWFELLQVNDEIDLNIRHFASSPVSFRTRALVTGVDCGSLDDMLCQFAASNHANRLGMKERPIGVFAANRLWNILSDIYQTEISYDDEVTVVHLARPTWTPIERITKP